MAGSIEGPRRVLDQMKVELWIPRVPWSHFCCNECKTNWKYLRHVLGIFLSGKSQADIRHILVISQAYLRYHSSLFRTYYRYISDTSFRHKFYITGCPKKIRLCFCLISRQPSTGFSKKNSPENWDPYVNFEYITISVRYLQNKLGFLITRFW